MRSTFFLLALLFLPLLIGLVRAEEVDPDVITITMPTTGGEYFKTPISSSHPCYQQKPTPRFGSMSDGEKSDILEKELICELMKFAQAKSEDELGISDYTLYRALGYVLARNVVPGFMFDYDYRKEHPPLKALFVSACNHVKQSRKLDKFCI
jgi:hypothetical protein